VTTTNIKRDGPLVAELLKKRPRQRFEAMAVVLWTITPEEDAFIYKTDRSLKILRHAADRLDRYVVARQRQVDAQHPRRSQQSDGVQARIARIIARLERHLDGELGDACGTVIMALRSGQTNLPNMTPRC
jgi:hypothetical protein